MAKLGRSGKNHAWPDPGAIVPEASFSTCSTEAWAAAPSGARLPCLTEHSVPWNDMNTETPDTTIADLHRIRREIAAKFNGDVFAINADARAIGRLWPTNHTSVSSVEPSAGPERPIRCDANGTLIAGRQVSYVTLTGVRARSAELAEVTPRQQRPWRQHAKQTTGASST